MKKYMLATFLAVFLSSQATAAEKTASAVTGAQLYEKILPKFALRYVLSLGGIAAGGYLIHKGINEQNKWKIAVGAAAVSGALYLGARTGFDQGYFSCMTEVWDIFTPQPRSQQ